MKSGKLKITTDNKRISDERLKFYIINSPLAVIEWDSDFIVTLWTGGAEDMFGWKSSEVKGKNISELNFIYEPDIQDVKETMKNLLSGKNRYLISKNRNYTKERYIIHCIWYNTILQDDNGKMDYVLSQVADVSRQVEYEMQLYQLNNEKDRFIRDLSSGMKTNIDAHANLTGHDYMFGKGFEEKSDNINYQENSVSKTNKLLKILEDKLKTESADDQIITVPHYNGFDIVKINEIIMCEADGYCTKFHLGNGKIIVSSKNLKYYEEKLTSSHFQRVHKSFIINLKQVNSYTNQGEIILSGQRTSYLGNSFKKDFIRNFIIK